VLHDVWNDLFASTWDNRGERIECQDQANVLGVRSVHRKVCLAAVKEFITGAKPTPHNIAQFADS
jgi:hypothetical protein